MIDHLSHYVIGCEGSTSDWQVVISFKPSVVKIILLISLMGCLCGEGDC